MPVMLISGEDTAPIHREIFKNVAETMPNAGLLRIPRAGHGVSRDQANAFNEAVLRFLGEQHLTGETQ